MKIRAQTIEEKTMVRYLLNDHYAFRHLIALKSFRTENERILNEITSLCPDHPELDENFEKIKETLTTLDKQAEILQQKYAETRTKVYDLIHTLEDQEQIDILSMKYLSHKSFDEITDEMNLSKSTILRIHLSGIHRLAEKHYAEIDNFI